MLEVDFILDDSSVHKHDAVKEWLSGNERVHFHFVPEVPPGSTWSSASSENSRNVSWSASSSPARSVIAAIVASIQNRNRSPKPFVWTASVKHVLDKVAKARETLGALHQVEVVRPNARVLGFIWSRQVKGFFGGMALWFRALRAVCVKTGLDVLCWSDIPHALSATVSAVRAELPAIEPAGRGRGLPLSFAQQRPWLLEQPGGSGPGHPISWRLRLRGELDR
jgi:hypothetical protein